MKMNFIKKSFSTILLVWCMALYANVHIDVECFFNEKLKFFDVVYKAFAKSCFLQCFTSIVLISIWGLWTISKLKDRNLSSKRFILNIFGVEILLLADLGWNTPCSGFGDVSLCSIVVMILVLDALVGGLKWLTYQKYDAEESSEDSFVLDNHDIVIIDATRKQYAESLLKRLRNVDNKEESFSLVIYGRWGTGKTLFLKCIEDLLYKKEEIVINFNPWNSHSSKQMLNSFFDNLSGILAEYDSSLEKPMVKYADVLTSLDLPKPIDVFASSILGNGDSNVDSLKEKIRNSLKRIGKSIYILIDDLDRLTKIEVLNVLCLIRNTANFPYLKYIVACDRNHIVTQLKDLNITPGYLEKIFMMELSLPTLYQDYPCVNRCREAVFEMTNDVSLINFFGLIAVDRLALLDESLGNLRQSERFARGLVLNWEFLKANIEESNQEIVPSEFVWLELIRIINKTLYEKLYSDPTIFLDVKKNKRYKQDMYVLKSDAELTRLKLNKCSVKILKTLFSLKGNFEVKHNSIVLLENYDKYFSLGKVYGHISKTKFLQIMNTDSTISDFDDKIGILTQKEAFSLFNMLLMLNIKRLKLSEKLRFLDLTIIYNQKYNYENSDALIDKLMEVLKDNSTKEKVNKYFLNRLSNTNGSYKQMLTVNLICSKIIGVMREKNDEFIKEDSLRNIVQSNFVRFIEDNDFDAADIVNRNTSLYDFVESAVVSYTVWDIDGSEAYNIDESLIHKQIINAFENKKSERIDYVNDFERIDIESGMPQEYYDVKEEQKMNEICKLFGSKANFEDFKRKCFVHN